MIEADIRQFSKANYRFSDGDRVRRADWTDRSFREALLFLTPNPDPDPFVLWIEALPAWDGEPRAERLWIDTLHIPETELSKAAGRRFLLGAVRRAYEPGCVHDWMPILVGPQGLGKSSILRELVPAALWFSDGAQLDGTPKENFETTGPAVISEFAEMAGLERAGVKMKNYLTQRRDRFRPAYGREPVDLGRRWVGVGTANPDPAGVLPADHSGHRRYVLLESSIDGRDNHLTQKASAARRWIKDNLAQLWAEALHEYRKARERKDAGMNLMGDFREQAEAAADGKSRENEGMADLAANLFEYGQERSQGCLIVELMVKAGLAEDEAAAAKDRRSQLALGRALTQARWVKRRRKVGEKQSWRWSPPDAPSQCVSCGEDYYPPDLSLDKVLKKHDVTRCDGCQDADGPAGGASSGSADGGEVAPRMSGMGASHMAYDEGPPLYNLIAQYKQTPEGLKEIGATLGIPLGLPDPRGDVRELATAVKVQCAGIEDYEAKALALEGWDLKGDDVYASAVEVLKDFEAELAQLQNQLPLKPARLPGTPSIIGERH